MKISFRLVCEYASPRISAGGGSSPSPSLSFPRTVEHVRFRRFAETDRFGFASGIVRGFRRALQTQEEPQEVIMALIRQMQAQSFRKSY